jgi:hypothetical protein
MVKPRGTPLSASLGLALPPPRSASGPPEPAQIGKGVKSPSLAFVPLLFYM